MVIECQHCKAKYQYSEERFEGKPSKKVRCVKCQQVFEVNNPAAVAPLTRAEALDETKGGRRRVPPDLSAPESSPVSSSYSSIPSDQTKETPTGKQDTKPKLPQGARLSLAVINGPDAGKVFRIEKPRVIIGRSDGDFTLNDSEASRSHAAIEIRDSIILLEDLGSTNGTFHKGKSVEEPQTLYNHSEFVIGATTLMVIVTRDG